MQFKVSSFLKLPSVNIFKLFSCPLFFHIDQKCMLKQQSKLLSSVPAFDENSTFPPLMWAFIYRIICLIYLTCSVVFSPRVSSWGKDKTSPHQTTNTSRGTEYFFFIFYLKKKMKMKAQTIERGQVMMRGSQLGSLARAGIIGKIL